MRESAITGKRAVDRLVIQMADRAVRLRRVVVRVPDGSQRRGDASTPEIATAIKASRGLIFDVAQTCLPLQAGEPTE